MWNVKINFWRKIVQILFTCALIPPGVNHQIIMYFKALNCTVRVGVYWIAIKTRTRNTGENTIQYKYHFYQLSAHLMRSIRCLYTPCKLFILCQYLWGIQSAAAIYEFFLWILCSFGYFLLGWETILDWLGSTEYCFIISYGWAKYTLFGLEEGVSVWWYPKVNRNN